MVRWFTQAPAGQRHARDIAREGSRWWARALRKQDMQVYMYRLILEYKRLLDPARVARPS